MAVVCPPLCSTVFPFPSLLSCGMNASGVLLFNTVLHEKFAQEVTENDYLQDLLLDF